MDFYWKYKEFLRFLDKLKQGVWCVWFCQNRTKEFRLGLRWWNHSNTHKSNNRSRPMTAVSEGVFPRRSKTTFFFFFLQIETRLIFLYYAIGIFFLPLVADNISLGSNKATFCARTSAGVHVVNQPNGQLQEPAVRIYLRFHNHL